MLGLPGGYVVVILEDNMAKVGINAFLLDCRTNENISEIEAEYGVKGFAVVVRLWQKIYFEKGYYCEWSGRSPLLFLSDWFGGNSGVTCSLINEIVDRCLSNGIFHAKMYEKYSILTSARIQSQYFDVVKRRETILVVKEYLLVSVDKINGIAYKNDVSVCRNQKNVCRNDTREDKVSKDKVSKEGIPPTRRFEEFWAAYPNKQRRHLAEQAYCELLLSGNATEEQMVQSARNYAKYIKDSGDKVFLPNNFLSKLAFVDYLDENYKPDARQSRGKNPKNSFHNFEQRDYDFDELMKQINGGG